jgi:glycosyltransferase involved in cell wall biosynthesis
MCELVSKSTSPLFSCFLLSHNKGPYAVQAIQSVLNQTFQDWECWIIENSTDTTTRPLLKQRMPEILTDPRFHYEEMTVPKEIRKTKYVPSWLLNVYHPEANGKWIFYLSDDDLLMEDCFEVCAEHINDHEDWAVAWFGLKGIRAVDHRVVKGMPIFMIPANGTRGKDSTNWNIDGYIDGGQVIYRKECLEQLEKPRFPETFEGDVARHSDGLFLLKLAEKYTFQPIYRTLAIHRFTPVSTWSKA